MNKNTELAKRMHDFSVGDGCIQLSLGYWKYLMLYGDKKLMYFNHQSEDFSKEEKKNAYLTDERRHSFPYSTIPEHIEIAQLNKTQYTNQILTFEQPYISIHDGLIVKRIIFKDDGGAISYSKVLNNTLVWPPKTKVVSREELEGYVKNGSLKQIDEEEYESTQIFDLSGTLYEPTLPKEEEIVNIQKNKLIARITNSHEYSEPQRLYVGSPTTVEPFIRCAMMIKFKANGEIKINEFDATYLEPDKYAITIADMPVTMENLKRIKEELSPIKTIKSPKISLLLNPDINREQLKQERAKVKALTKARQF